MTKIVIEEKYERNGWPSLKRPDVEPPAGWSLSLTTSVNRIFNHQLSPNGERIAFLWNREGQTDVYTMPATGGWPARITTNRPSWPFWWEEVPQWSPGGQWLAFCIDGQVHVVPAGGGIPQPITDFYEASSPVWLPDSRHLVVTVKRDDVPKLFLTDRDGESLRVLTAGTGDDQDARPSPAGRLVAYVHRPADDLNRWDVRIVDLETGEARLLVGDPKQKDWSPRWAPDGSQIAFLSQRSGWNEVWLIRPDGQGMRQLTHLGMDVAGLAWSPDGSRLACTVNRGGAFDLGLIDAQSGELSDLRTGLGTYARPNWSPDGETLTVEYEAPTQPPDLYRVDVATGEAVQLTFSKPPALARNDLVMPEAVGYRSYDGLEVPALLFRPAEPNGAAILYPHGGPTDQYGYFWDVLVQYFVAKGYTYLAPNFRGSTGYGVEYEHANYDDWGGGDTQDCLHGAKYLRDLDWIDPQRIGIYGGSYGGYMVACCLSRDPEYLFACGVSKYGDADLFSSWAQCERTTRLYTEMQIGHPATNRQVYLDGSPLYDVERVQKPVLILHGLDDDVVPPQASEEWVDTLRRAGKTFEYKTYAGEPHGFQKRATVLDVYERVERFFDWYLM